ncbi:uncharacterized protein LOC143040030 isoform X2 [Oratosquilla oratoria]|uniref:uncharacterized protein LOC143040030 isoform X2 n=1 Tax=Oratosquilla oratoria TaxID=337810 RepID=UPI003F762868
MFQRRRSRSKSCCFRLLVLFPHAGPLTPFIDHPNLPPSPATRSLTRKVLKTSTPLDLSS